VTTRGFDFCNFGANEPKSLEFFLSFL